jgi:hypothetical protein
MGTTSGLRAPFQLAVRAAALLVAAAIVTSCVYLASFLDGIDYPEHLRIYPTSPERIHGGTFDEAERVAVWIDDQSVGDATVSEDQHEWEIPVTQMLAPGVHHVRATSFHDETTTTYDETFGVGDAPFDVVIEPDHVQAAPGATFNDVRVLISILGPVDADPQPSVQLGELTQADPLTPVVNLRYVEPLQAGMSIYPAVEVPADTPPGDWWIGIIADGPEGTRRARATLIVTVEGGPTVSPSPAGGGSRPGG